ncbi:GGDEF domain-containing protein [Psychrosphaera aestuarii]|uniref:GGDEF domain-containing protein n=1 Tax=Psychrosphaera aestuarii TaxID=1266052 RepID=UPI001B3370B8|nr:GGDEF domain-containing protein [Psychrosphaera aestuarii]
MSTKSNSEVTKLLDVNASLDKNLTESFKLVERFGTLLKGNQKELDHKLAGLRKAIKQTSTGDDLSLHITSVNQSLKGFESEFSTCLRNIKQDMLDIGESLQSIKGMDADLRRNLRMVLNKIKATDSSILTEIQPNITKLVKILISINAPGSNSKISKPETTGLSNNMIERLISGLVQLSQKDVIKPSLDSFSDRIRISNSDEQKLDICLGFFEDVVGRFSEEFTQTQSLIVNINKALADVHTTLIESLKSSKGYDKQLRALNSQIDKQIKELSESTSTATSLNELQVVIDKKLSVINTSIKKRDDIEQQRSDKLQKSLNAMEAKLGGLEQRTDYYRNKWLEEKVRNGIDTLTGLPNRGAYDNRIQEEYQRWLRQPQPLTIAVIDIDHFKKINDNYGHSVGDKTLKIVANTLQKNLRKTDFLARYGGEEFVVIMINSDPNKVAGPLEKLRMAVEKIPFKVKDTPLNITISIGFTAFLAADNVHTAFDRADKALYEAKHSGRNKVCYKK